MDILINFHIECFFLLLQRKVIISLVYNKTKIETNEQWNYSNYLDSTRNNNNNETNSKRNTVVMNINRI